MTRTTSPARASAKRREQEWLAEYRRRRQQLESLPPDDLDALVAATVCPDLAGRPFSTSWDALSLLLERMRGHGYTVQLTSYEPSHVEWINHLPDHFRREP